MSIEQIVRMTFIGASTIYWTDLQYAEPNCESVRSFVSPNALTYDMHTHRRTARKHKRKDDQQARDRERVTLRRTAARIDL